MKVEFTPQFLRDLKKIRDQKLRDELAGIIRSAEEAAALTDLHQVKKMKGAANAFRIKLGDYRLGFYEMEDGLLLTRFLHRKDIYRYFPK